jgi:type IV secretory pathway TrbL component
MAVVGDRVQILSKKVGAAPRDGVVTGVTGSLLRVRWSTGEESTVVPSMGSLTVVGKQSGGDGRRRQTTSASAAKGQIGTRSAPRRVAASKQVTKAAKESGQATRSQTAQKAAKVAAQPKRASKLPR